MRRKTTTPDSRRRRPPALPFPGEANMRRSAAPMTEHDIP